MTVQAMAGFDSSLPDGAHEARRLIDVRLAAARVAARDINLFEFARVDGGNLPPAEAGAHIDLHLPNGLVRQYSLLPSNSAPSTYCIGVKHDRSGRGGSRFMHQALAVGTQLRIGGPRNHFPLVETADPVVLIAGGIGITPIWAMVQSLRLTRRPWQMFYSVRARLDALFASELSGLEQAHLHIDEDNGNRVMDIAAIVARAPKTAHLYCCGPSPMLDAFAAATRVWPPGQIHVERFSGASPEIAHDAFVVELSRSGREVTIPPGVTILHALRAAGLDVESSCEAGVCGACETRILSGIPDHRDVVLTDAEHAANDRMMICCSGSKSSRLVLDL